MGTGAMCKDFIILTRATVTERVGLCEQNIDVAAAVDAISDDNVSLTNLNSTATSNAGLFQRIIKAAASGLADSSNRADLWGLKTCFWRISL